MADESAGQRSCYVLAGKAANGCSVWLALEAQTESYTVA